MLVLITDTSPGPRMAAYIDWPPGATVTPNGPAVADAGTFTRAAEHLFIV